MIDKRVASVEAALADLQDGASVMVGGFGGSGYPASLVHELRRRGTRDLTIVVNNAGTASTGIGVLIASRQVRRVICSFPVGRSAKQGMEVFWELQHAGKMAIEIVPQGTLAERIRAGGAGIPAFYTPTGAGTVLAEGKEQREFDGRPCLLEHALTADFAFLRAASADRWGNLSYRKAQRNFNVIMAAAARTTVAEVFEMAGEAAIDPELVGTPGIYVDRLVVVPDDRQERLRRGQSG